MNFKSVGRDGYNEEDEQMIHKSGKLAFYPSSASSSSSSPQYYRSFFPGSETPIYTHYEGETAGAASAPNFELNISRTNQPRELDLTGESSSAPKFECSSSQSATLIQKEHMFDKVVTPSDVGKLNRLVIPKQHAEKYFPLDATNDKGLLLNFEDRTGKPWRFRYSYWNSSQSYVMTKGWSRFVKEKKLDAGDIVSFQRGAGESAKDRLFIDWRRRTHDPTLSYNPNSLSNFAFHRSVPWSPMFFRPPPTANYSSSYLPQQHQNNVNFHQNQIRNNYHYMNNTMNPSYIYLRSPTGIESQVNTVFDSVPVVHHGKAASKKMRLFGVNMECGVSSSSLLSEIDENNNGATIEAHDHESRLYNGVPLQIDFLNKGKSSSSSMSLDLDI